MMALLTSVLVRTSSLLLALYTTPMSRVFFVTCSLPHAKLPASSRSARCFTFPPRTRTVCTRFGPSFVSAGCRPSSNLRFLR